MLGGFLRILGRPGGNTMLPKGGLIIGHSLENGTDRTPALRIDTNRIERWYDVERNQNISAEIQKWIPIINKATRKNMIEKLDISGEVMLIKY